MNELPSSPTEGQIATSQGLRYRSIGGVWELLGTGMPGGCIDVQDNFMPGAGTWTKPANAEIVIVELVGAGGGGAGGPGGSEGSAGGGGGAYARFVFPAALLGATEPIVVGTPGSAGTPTGGNGGDSSFGPPELKAFAQGGRGATVTGTTGSARGGGYLIDSVNVPMDYVNVWSGGSCDPDAGVTPHSTMGAGAGGAGTGHASTIVGVGLFGTGGKGGTGSTNTNTPATAGSVPGGGGGGGFGTGNGAAGAMGRVRVYTFGREA